MVSVKGRACMCFTDAGISGKCTSMKCTHVQAPPIVVDVQCYYTFVRLIYDVLIIRCCMACLMLVKCAHIW